MLAKELKKMRPFVVSALRKASIRHIINHQRLCAVTSRPPSAWSQVRNISLETTQFKFDDYEYEKKHFNIHVPEYFNFAKDVVDGWAAAEKAGVRDSSIPAFWWVDAATKKELKWTFQDLSQESKRVANALVSGCGLQSGDRVLIILPKVPEWWSINVACIRADLTMSAGTILLRTKDIQHRLDQSKAKCIITIPELCDSVDKAASDNENLREKLVVGERSETPPGWKNYDKLLEKAGPDFESVNTKSSDIMTFYFTSGTTGAPKMALHTHASYGLGHLITARYWLRNTPKNIIWNVSDPGWVKCAWTSMFAPWIFGSCVFVSHSSGNFDPVETLQVLRDYPVDKLCTPPTGLRFMVKEPLHKYPFKALNHCVSGGEPVNPELIEQWTNKAGMTIYEGYGQSETTLVCSRFQCIPYKPGSLGKACPGLDVAVVDGEGRELPPNTEGTLGIKWKPHRPIGLFLHYLNNPEKTAAVFKGDYYLTGDRCFMDEEDYVFFVGRADDVIISAGYRIGPFEVESALLEHPAVVESAVVSSPDETRGCVVKSFVVLREEYLNTDKEKLTKELQDYVKTVTAPYKYPRKIEFVTELPKTISGKILRNELRNKEHQKHN